MDGWQIERSPPLDQSNGRCLLIKHFLKRLEFQVFFTTTFWP